MQGKRSAVQKRECRICTVIFEKVPKPTMRSNCGLYDVHFLCAARISRLCWAGIPGSSSGAMALMQDRRWDEDGRTFDRYR